MILIFICHSWTTPQGLQSMSRLFRISCVLINPLKPHCCLSVPLIHQTCHFPSKIVPLGPFHSLAFLFPPHLSIQCLSSCYPTFVYQKKKKKERKREKQSDKIKLSSESHGQKTSKQTKEFPINVPIVQTQKQKPMEGQKVTQNYIASQKQRQDRVQGSWFEIKFQAI